MFKYCTKIVWFLVVLQESYTSDYWSQRLILFILLFLLQLPSSHSLSHPALLVVERSEVNERACLVIKSMKSTEKEMSNSCIEFHFCFIARSTHDCGRSKRSVWGYGRPCHLFGSTAYLCDLACAAKLVRVKSCLILFLQHWCLISHYYH